MVVRPLKTWPPIFGDMAEGRKPFDYRKNDRDFQVGDVLLLQEFDPLSGEYSGRDYAAEITYMVKGGQFGIPKGYCIMALKPAESATGQQGG